MKREQPVGLKKHGLSLINMEEVLMSSFSLEAGTLVTFSTTFLRSTLSIFVHLKKVT